MTWVIHIDADTSWHMGVSKNRGGKPPKMDGENNGKPYEQMDDLGVPLLLETPIFSKFFIAVNRENAGTLGMVPLIINPIYTLYSGYLDVFIG